MGILYPIQDIVGLEYFLAGMRNHRKDGDHMEITLINRIKNEIIIVFRVN